MFSILRNVCPCLEHIMLTTKIVEKYDDDE